MSARHLPTASYLIRAVLCVGSVVIPSHLTSSDSAERGHWRHEYLADVPEIGKEAALAKIPERFREMCRRIQLDGLPLDPSYVREIAIGYDFATGKAREIGRRINRQYGQLGLLEIAGSADVAWLSGDMVVVADFKGHSDTIDLAHHWQLRFLALVLCRLWGKSRAVIQRYRIMYDGSHIPSQLLLTEEMHQETESVLLRFIDRWLQACLDVDAGRSPAVSMGETQCTYCDAFFSCPVASWWPALWEKRVTKSGKLDADKLYDVMKREHGQQAADIAVERDASIASLHRGMEWLREQGKIKQMAPEQRRLLAIIGQEDGTEELKSA